MDEDSRALDLDSELLHRDRVFPSDGILSQPRSRTVGEDAEVDC